MTPAMVYALRRLIDADREYRREREKGWPSSPIVRGVEVSMISGVSKRTAKALEDAGLAEMVDEGGLVYLFLGTYDPLGTL